VLGLVVIGTISIDLFLETKNLRRDRNTLRLEFIAVSNNKCVLRPVQKQLLGTTTKKKQTEYSLSPL
jgi:hypothetical protein